MEEFIGEEIEVYCETEFEQHILPGLFKWLQFAYAYLANLFLLLTGEFLEFL